MMQEESIIELQTQLAHLQRHVEEQDAEIYKLATRVEQLMELLQRQNLQLQAMNARGGDGLPAHEKPPHY